MILMAMEDLRHCATVKHFEVLLEFQRSLALMATLRQAVMYPRRKGKVREPHHSYASFRRFSIVSLQATPSVVNQPALKASTWDSCGHTAI